MGFSKANPRQIGERTFSKGVGPSFSYGLANQNMEREPNEGHGSPSPPYGLVPSKAKSPTGIRSSMKKTEREDSNGVGPKSPKGGEVQFWGGTLELNKKYHVGLEVPKSFGTPSLSSKEGVSTSRASRRQEETKGDSKVERSQEEVKRENHSVKGRCLLQRLGI